MLPLNLWQSYQMKMFKPFVAGSLSTLSFWVCEGVVSRSRMPCMDGISIGGEDSQT